MERLHSHSRASEGDDDDFWTIILERGEDALSICRALPADGIRKGGSTALHSCTAQLHCTAALHSCTAQVCHLSQQVLA